MIEYDSGAACSKTYSPKESSLRTHRVGPIGLSGSLSLSLLVVNFDQPTNRATYLVSGGVVGGGAYYLKKFYVSKTRFFYSIFF